MSKEKETDCTWCKWYGGFDEGEGGCSESYCSCNDTQNDCKGSDFPEYERHCPYFESKYD